MALLNPSFETPGVTPGEADNWGFAVSDSADDYAMFDSGSVPYEAFALGWAEAGWPGFGIESAIRAFKTSDLGVATFDGGPSYERFDGNWLAPNVKGKATTTSSATKGVWVRGKTSKARGFLGPGTSGTTIYTWFVTGSPPEFTSSEVLDVLQEQTLSLGTSDGSKKTYAGTFTSTPLTTKTVTIYYWKSDGTLSSITDDGLGTFTHSDLNSTATNTVDYNTGAVSVTFNTPPLKNSLVIAVAEGVSSTLTLSGAWTRIYESPWVEEGLSDFNGSPSPIAAATFDGETYEDFEDLWNDERGVGDNSDGQTTFSASDLATASFDSGTPENYEDFEEEWLSNQNGKTSFSTSDLARALFDVAGDDYEDFETEWTTGSFII